VNDEEGDVGREQKALTIKIENWQRDRETP
jgi:hypothetical protein